MAKKHWVSGGDFVGMPYGNNHYVRPNGDLVWSHSSGYANSYGEFNECPKEVREGPRIEYFVLNIRDGYKWKFVVSNVESQKIHLGRGARRGLGGGPAVIRYIRKTSVVLCGRLLPTMRILIRTGKGGMCNVTYQPGEIEEIVKKVNPFVSKPFFDMMGFDLGGDRFVKSYWEAFNRNILDVKGLDIRKVEYPFYEIAKHARLSDVAKVLFGVSGKTAVKLLLECNDAIVRKGHGTTPYRGNCTSALVATIFKGLLPWDTIASVCLKQLEKNEPFPMMIDRRIRSIRCMLRAVPQSLRLKALKDLNAEFSFEFLDSCEMYSKVKGTQFAQGMEQYFDSWHALHNFLIRACAFKDKLADAEKFAKEFKFTESKRVAWMSDVESREWEGYTIKFPKTYGELFNWGTEMHHCIYGYGEDYQASRCILFGLYKHGVLVYNLMLRGNQVSQFYGKYNCRPKSSEEVMAVHRIVVDMNTHNGYVVDVGSLNEWFPADRKVLEGL